MRDVRAGSGRQHTGRNEATVTLLWGARADARRLISRPPGLGRTGRATGISGVSAALRTPVTSAPPAPRLRWRQTGRTGTAAAPGRRGWRLHRGYSPTAGMKAAPMAATRRGVKEGRRGDTEKSEEIGRKAEQRGFAKLAENE